ncbi:MAG: D-alanyl-D-alanine carboxypeptidase family protein [Halanaerobiaceae bacterium]
MKSTGMGEDMQLTKLAFKIFFGTKIFSLCSIFILSLMLLLILFSDPLFAAQPPQVSAATAAVIDVKTGQVLYDKHMHLRKYPASTTKVLTAIIAIEEGNLNETVTVSRNAAYQEGSSIWLAEGEQLTLKELVYAIMLASGNDAAVAIAEHISGSVEDFADLMNKKAEDMGAENSTFLNPHGLPQSGHYSTAYDLAMIMRYALQNETFAEITATKYKTISWPDHEWDRGLRNHNKLLWQYDDATGGKTGYTKAAGRCLITSASRNNREVVAVVLNSPDDWLDCTRLLDYGLDEFNEVVVVEAGTSIYDLDWEQTLEKKLNLIARNSIAVAVPVDDKINVKKKIELLPELKLPVTEGQKVGKLKLYHDDRLLDSTDLVAGNDLNFSSVFLRFWYRLTYMLRNFAQKQDFKYLSRNKLIMETELMI